MSHETGNQYPTHVEIIEVGPRDGLQRESRIVSTADKIALIEALVAAGLRRIQVTSFVHPRLVPQMADAEEVCAGIPRTAEVDYSGLALNLRGVERAHDAGLAHIDISVSASDAHSRRNANRSLVEALEEFKSMYARAREYGMKVRGGIQCAFGYQTPDDVDVGGVVAIARHHLSLGVDELALADTAGLANPSRVSVLMETVLPHAKEIPLVLHLHDTRGMGLANLLAAMGCGVRHFDTSFGGLGGCPFVEGATGNIATEDTVHMLHEMGIQTGVDLRKLASISRRYAHLLGKSSLPGKVYAFYAPEAT